MSGTELLAFLCIPDPLFLPPSLPPGCKTFSHFALHSGTPSELGDLVMILSPSPQPGARAIPKLANVYITNCFERKKQHCINNLCSKLTTRRNSCLAHRNLSTEETPLNFDQIMPETRTKSFSNTLITMFSHLK